MLAVLPLDISVSGLLEYVRLESRGYCKSAQPRYYRYVNAIWRRIANNEAYSRRCLAATPKSMPNAREVTEVAGHHQVISLLPPF
jgi:hypothetical protein